MTRKRSLLRLAMPVLAACAVVASGCAEKEDEADEKEKSCQQTDVCRDCDCDTICDQHEGVVEDSTCVYSTGKERDTDDDGTPDYLDEDSDGDGVPDIEEAGDDDLKTEPCGPRTFIGCGYLNPRMPYTPLPEAGGFDAIVPDVSKDTAFPDLQDGQGAYDPGDAGPIALDSCSPIAVRCLEDIQEGYVGGLCDGLDNDCDGLVDEKCDCEVAGKIQSCFLGPPSRAGQGACRSGIQVCQYVQEFTFWWGPCEQSISPSQEVCDGLDNDCNGCIDEVPDCVPEGECPTRDDSRVPKARPFTTYGLNGEDFYYKDDATEWHWEVTGSPCDRLFQSIDANATSSSGTLSYKLEGENQRNAIVSFSLSGAYQVKLTVERDGKSAFSCTWVMSVSAPGLRVELCWDKTGDVATRNGEGVDLDLHLGRTPGTAAWFEESDCYQRTCRGDDTPWDYENTTDLESCTGENAPNYQAYHEFLQYCPNPRLDIDNKNMTASKYVTENINLDNPRAGDRFRVMVEYYANIKADAITSDSGVPLPTIETHPLVNVYCNGALRGSYGGLPDRALQDQPQFSALQGFDTPGEMWRVVDIAIQDADVDCELTPVGGSDSGSIYSITARDETYP
ncbi:MAG: hypothetical protein JXA30_14285 [Deltaproteobacteria bacterium]|nr:hypothetical protein [Deltaproteobacteria bacterium]